MKYTKRLVTKRGDNVAIRVFTNKRWKLVWHVLRGYYEFGRGNGYDHNDLW